MKAYIKIYEADINRLQAYQYDKDSKFDILTRILSDNSIDINKELFKEYVVEYSESYVYLEVMKKEMEDKYIPVGIAGNVSWNINFHNNTMTLDADSLDSNDIKRLEDNGFVIENS